MPKSKMNKGFRLPLQVAVLIVFTVSLFIHPGTAKAFGWFDLVGLCSKNGQTVLACVNVAGDCWGSGLNVDYCVGQANKEMEKAGIPPATTAPAEVTAEVKGVYTTDENNVTKKTFKHNEEIRLNIKFNKNVLKGEMPETRWKVFPKGKYGVDDKIQDFTFENSDPFSGDTDWVYLRRRIPAGLADGKYTFKGTLIYQGHETAAITDFTIDNSPAGGTGNPPATTAPVEIKEVYTADEYNGKPKKFFKHNEKIWLYIKFSKNANKLGLLGEKFEVFLKGTDKKIQKFTYEGATFYGYDVDLAYDADETNREYVIPAELADGKYTFRGTLNHLGKETVAYSDFEIYNSPAGGTGNPPLSKVEQGCSKDGQVVQACVDAVSACVDDEVPEDTCIKLAKERYIDVPAEGTGTAPVTKPPTTETGAVGTTTKAYIHGFMGGDFEDTKWTESWISVGSRTYPTNSESACVNSFVDMTLTKIAADGKETNIPVSFTGVGEGNSLVPTNDNSHRNCWSYQAKLPAGMSKNGTYRLDAVFKGTVTYKGSDSSVEVTYTDNKAKIGTQTKVKVQTGSGATTYLPNGSTPKIALSKLMKSSGNVAGAQARIEGGLVKIINDPASPDGTITLIPESSAGGGSCDSQNLPTTYFVVVKVLKGGAVETIEDNPVYPNCQPWVLPLSKLGDLSQISRIEATSSLPGDANYQSSQGDIVIAVSDDGVSAGTYVNLSSDPDAFNISPTNASVTIVASTNKVAANPVLKVNRNGSESSLPASSSAETCKDGTGTCVYSFIIYQPDGNYKVTFVNGEASNSLSFSTRDKTAGDITKVGLLVHGEEVPLALNGGQINITLDGSPTQAFLLKIHYKDGTETQKSLIINYNQPADWNCVYSQGGSCYGGYTKDLSTCTQVNGTCLNPTAGCEYRGGPVACPKGITATPTPAAAAPSGVCKEGRSDFKYNQCIACNTSQAVCQDANGNFTTGPNQSDNTGGCSSWCNNTPPPVAVPDAGTPGKDCIYSQEGKCYSGKVAGQSSCSTMTTVTNVCINPSGGCTWGDGSKEVNCTTGQ